MDTLEGFLETPNFIIMVGALAFLPLFWSEMVILPLLFELCEFTPGFWKWRKSLPLFRENELTVLNCQEKTNLSLQICPYYYAILVILPLFWMEELDNILTGIKRIFSSKLKSDFYSFNIILVATWHYSQQITFYRQLTISILGSKTTFLMQILILFPCKLVQQDAK